MLGWNEEQQPLSSRWIGTRRNSIWFSCCFVPEFFGELLVEVVVRVRVSMEQVLGQPVDAQGISQGLHFQEQE